MARTLEQIDEKLTEAVAARAKCREALASKTVPLSEGQRDSMLIRESLLDEWIERLLDERFEALVLQLATL